MLRAATAHCGTASYIGSQDELAETEGAKFLSESELAELVRELDRLVSTWNRPEFPLHVVGGAIIGQRINAAMNRDARAYGSGALIVTAFLLFALFRRVSAIVYPLVIVVSALISTLGIMVAIGIPFSITMSMVPVFLLTVGVCDAVHLLVIVYQQIAQGRSREDAVVFALGHSGLAILLTSLTTAAGLMSFLTAALDPISHLGVIVPIGVLLAFAYTVTLLPALLVTLPLAERPRTHGDAGRRAWHW